MPKILIVVLVLIAVVFAIGIGMGRRKGDPPPEADHFDAKATGADRLAVLGFGLDASEINGPCLQGRSFSVNRTCAVTIAASKSRFFGKLPRRLTLTLSGAQPVFVAYAPACPPQKPLDEMKPQQKWIPDGGKTSVDLAVLPCGGTLTLTCSGNTACAVSLP